MELAEKKRLAVDLMGWEFIPEREETKDKSGKVIRGEVAKFITGPDKQFDWIWAQDWLHFPNGTDENNVYEQFKEVLERLTDDQQITVHNLLDINVHPMAEVIYCLNNMPEVIQAILQVITPSN